MAGCMRAALLLASILALPHIVPADASSIGSAFWLKQYEHADSTWNNVAHAYVLGILDGAGTFGGIRCPEALSPRTVAAMTADVIKETTGNEPALNAVMKAAIRLRCVVDTDLIRRAADMLERERKR